MVHWHNDAKHANILTFLSLTACVMLVRVCPRGIIETLCSLKCSLSKPATVCGSTTSDRSTSDPVVTMTLGKWNNGSLLCNSVIFGDKEE